MKETKGMDTAKITYIHGGKQKKTNRKTCNITLIQKIYTNTQKHLHSFRSTNHTHSIASTQKHTHKNTKDKQRINAILNRLKKNTAEETYLNK